MKYKYKYEQEIKKNLENLNIKNVLLLYKIFDHKFISKITKTRGRQ